jgi:RNA polymerase sigma factor (sigma-70 family)
LEFSIVINISLHSPAGGNGQVIPLSYFSSGGPVYTRKQQKKPAKAEVYWLPRTPVDFYTFDEDYLQRLGARDPATEGHFVAYFSERIKITLRARGVDSHTIDDVRQETFCRVWVAVQEGKVKNPGGFGSFVHSVCKNVLSESRRDGHPELHEPLDSIDLADEQLNLVDSMQQKENAKLVRAILSELTEKDRHLLQARFFEDRDSGDICNDFRVDRDYLRVLLHRAIHKFGELYKQRVY